MQPRNNQLVVSAGLVLAFACAIPAKWYTLTKIGVTVSGFNDFVVLPLEAPIWLLLAFSMFFTVVSALNIMQVTSIPWYVLAVGLLLPGLAYLQPFFVPPDLISVAAGPALALVATLASLALVFARATMPQWQVAPTVAAEPEV